MTTLPAAYIEDLQDCTEVNAQAIIYWLRNQQQIDDTSSNGTQDNQGQIAAYERARRRAEEAVILHDRFPGVQYHERWFRATVTLAEALTPREELTP